MTDMVPAGTGNSRYLKSISTFLTTYPTYTDFAAALIAGTLPIDFNGINPSGITTEGTPLNKLNLLSDAAAAKLGLTGDPTLSDAFSRLGKLSAQNVSVSTWNSDSTYSVYPYRASIPITGVDTTYSATVYFANEQATSGAYAPVTATYSGGVYIYSSSNSTITIPLIICEVI